MRACDVKRLDEWNAELSKLCVMYVRNLCNVFDDVCIVLFCFALSGSLQYNACMCVVVFIILYCRSSRRGVWSCVVV